MFSVLGMVVVVYVVIGGCVAVWALCQDKQFAIENPVWSIPFGLATVIFWPGIMLMALCEDPWRDR